VAAHDERMAACEQQLLLVDHILYLVGGDE
jgi:hypothetical protein